MKSLLVWGAVTAAAATFASCRNLILEDRSPCPAFLLFDIANAQQLDNAEYVHIAAFVYPEETLLAKDTTTVHEVQDKEFYLAVKRSESVFGYGMAGFRNCHLVNETDWVVDEGADFDRLWRFDYRTTATEEDYKIPVEVVKDHSNVTVFFNGYDQFPGSGGRFPFEIIVRSNTVGINGYTGEPLPGTFLYAPKEGPGGTFCFTVPRQYDRSLSVEVWDPDCDSLIASFCVWNWVYSQEDFSWEEKNLPDILVTIQLTTGQYTFEVMPWRSGDGGYIYEL